MSTVLFVWLLATQGSNSCVCIVPDRSEPLLFTNAPTAPEACVSPGVSEPSLNAMFYRDLLGRWVVSQWIDWLRALRFQSFLIPTPKVLAYEGFGDHLMGRQKRQNSTTRVIEPISASSLGVRGTGNNSSIISVASFSWVWWAPGETLVTFTAVWVVRTTGYSAFYLSSRFWAGILFPNTRLPGWNSWTCSDTVSQTIWWIVLWVCWRACKDLRREWLVISALWTSPLVMGYIRLLGGLKVGCWLHFLQSQGHISFICPELCGL